MTALYFRDKDSDEWQKLGDGKIEEIDTISEADVDVVDERHIKSFDPNKTMTFTFKPPRIIDTTAREIEEGDKIRGLRASANCVDDFPFLEEEEDEEN